MAIPPPPPPPIANLKLAPSGNNKSGAGGADPRSALLQSIQKGAKLKKTVTVDKSGPILAGKVNNSTTAPSARSIANHAAPGGGAANASNAIQTNNGMPKLGGIFEGLSSMPKLKPVGGRATTSRTSPPSESPSHSASPSAAVPNNAVNGVSDFNAELTKHLTLKKQQKQSQHGTSSASSDSGSRINRGPPPQPPSKATADTTQLPANNYLFKQNQHQNSEHSSPTSTNETNIPVQPNKSSLFGKGAAPTIDTSSSGGGGNINNNNNNNNNNNSNSSSNSSSISNISNHATSKTVPNHGKPNCAPKPPGIQQIIAAKNNNNANGNLSSGSTNSTRTAVSRHHSMRSPRSPPISVATGPVFPTTQHFGTMRGAPPSFQSQDAINTSIRQQPSVPISRPTVAPPRPPNMKPPPPPIRSISNTNLTTLPLSMPASVANANNFGSASNVSTLKEQFSSIKTQSDVTSSANNVSSLVSSTSTLNSSNASANHTNITLSPASSKDRNVNGTIAPPLPPHRTCPAPPPPIRQTSITPTANTTNNSGGAPPVPQRGSSMRNSNSNVQQMIAASTKSSSPSSSNQQFASTTVASTTRTTAVSRIVVDLDAKFGNAFHNVTEFPPPSPFTNFQKTYPSRTRTNVRTQTEIKKAKAPSPPVRPSDTSTISEKSDKYYLQLDDEKNCSKDSSYC